MRTSPRLHRLEKSADAMGSTYTIVLYGQDLYEMEAAIAVAFQEIRRVEQMLSVYLPESEWSGINQKAEHGALRVSRESFLLLSRCLDYSRQSDGAFDITVGALLRLWGFSSGTGRLPETAEIATSLKQVGWRSVLLDSSFRTVRFERPGLEINPGGIGKGYTVDRVVDGLRRGGFDTALVLASSSTIYGMGAPPTEPRGWPIEIRNPWRPRESAAQVYLKDESVSTSGGARQTFWAGGKLYSHIIDPRTGYPARGAVLASVVAPSATDSEAWSKPGFINSRSWIEEHSPEGFAIFRCEEGSDGTCGWIGPRRDA